MKMLIKNATVVDENSKHHMQVKDLLIENGTIIRLEDNITTADADVFEAKNLHVSLGWTELNARFGEPGHEYKEDLESGLSAAAKGGFTQVALMPSTKPCIQSKTDVSFLTQRTAKHAVNLLPIGALTENRDGKQITEMYDMHQSGAIAFSDDKRSIENAHVMKIAMLYAKNFDGLIMSFSSEKKTANLGQMNEGVTSTKLGLKGIPSLAEELQLARDLQLCEYTNAKVHFSSLTTAESMKMIREAKNKGLNITADTSSYHLLLDDTKLEQFDSNLKVNPPLRSKKDIKALKDALKDGTLDAVTSDHQPQNIENKKCEFDMAAFGMINLETSFSVANTALKANLSIEEIIPKFTSAPRKILGLEIPTIEEGAVADLTIFNPELKWKLHKKEIVSKSKNTALTNLEFTGKPLAIYNNGQFVPCN